MTKKYQHDDDMDGYVDQDGERFNKMTTISYEDWLARLAIKQNTTPQVLEEKYGDMCRDMYDSGDRTGQAKQFLEDEDAMWKRLEDYEWEPQ